MGNRKLNPKNIDEAIRNNEDISADWQREHMENGYILIQEITEHITDISDNGAPILSTSYLTESLSVQFRQLYAVLLRYYERAEVYERCSELVVMMKNVESALARMNRIDEKK